MKTAEFLRSRLRTALPRLRKRHKVAAAEYAADWNSDCEKAEADRDALAQEFAEVYPVSWQALSLNGLVLGEDIRGHLDSFCVGGVGAIDYGLFPIGSNQFAWPTVSAAFACRPDCNRGGGRQTGGYLKDRRGDKRMLTLRHGLVALLFVIGVSASWAQSQPPSPSAGGEQKTIAEVKKEQEKPPNEDKLTIVTERLFYATVALAAIAAFQLGVFGWQGWQLKRSVDSDHVAQRAYIFGGGPHGRSDDAIVHGAIENDGRTPGFLKRVDWGICDEEAFPKNVRVSEIIDKELVPKGVINTVEGVEDVYPPTPKGQLYRQIEFERAPNIGKIFFGRFVYEDIFHKRRYSTFKLKLTEKTGSDPLPGCYSDWS